MILPTYIGLSDKLTRFWVGYTLGLLLTEWYFSTLAEEYWILFNFEIFAHFLPIFGPFLTKKWYHIGLIIYIIIKMYVWAYPYMLKYYVAIQWQATVIHRTSSPDKALLWVHIGSILAFCSEKTDYSKKPTYYLTQILWFKKYFFGRLIPLCLLWYWSNLLYEQIPNHLSIVEATLARRALRSPQYK